jgi:hypothetical protein
MTSGPRLYRNETTPSKVPSLLQSGYILCKAAGTWHGQKEPAMKAFVTFASPVLSFAAAMTALLGANRQPDQTGFPRRRRLAGCPALVGLGLTRSNAHAQQLTIRRGG